jgi:hypothetical protein
VRFCLIKLVKFTVSILALVTACLAEEGLTIESKHKQKVVVPEVENIYFSACSVVRKEFDVKRAGLPRIKLVLGSSENRVLFDEREIWLVRWDRYLFAEGVVMLAFDDLLTGDRRISLTKRAVNWADATVGVEGLAK